MSDDVALERTMSLSWPIDLRLTWRPLQRGPHDLTTRVWEQQAVRATHTPEGPATLHVHVDGKSRTLTARAWGPGKTGRLSGFPTWWACPTTAHHFARCFAKALRYPASF